MASAECSCASSKVERFGQHGNGRECLNCGREWYVSNCWGCRARIDSRAAGVAQCTNCNWYRCASCGACREDCTEKEKGGSEDKLFSENEGHDESKSGLGFLRKSKKKKNNSFPF